MKVLIVGPESYHTTRFVENLISIEKELYFLGESPLNSTHLKQQYIINLRGNPIGYFTRFIKLFFTIKFLKPTVIHIHSINRLAFFVSLVAFKLKIPVIVTAWGSDVLLVPSSSWINKRLVRFVIKKCTILTADSRQIIDVVKEMVPDCSCELLQYGIKLIEPKEKLNVILSTRLHEELYNIDKIITYFSEVTKEFPTWNLVIGGTGSKTDDLKRQVNTLGLGDKIKFLGWLDEAEKEYWYGVSKIFISVPDSDGTSVSLLEALSAGCLPILSDLTVTKEWIEDNQTGIILKPMINPIKEAILFDKIEYLETNRNVVLQKADVSCNIKLFYDLYQKCKTDL